MFERINLYPIYLNFTVIFSNLAIRIIIAQIFNKEFKLKNKIKIILFYFASPIMI